MKSSDSCCGKVLLKKPQPHGQLHEHYSYCQLSLDLLLPQGRKSLSSEDLLRPDKSCQALQTIRSKLYTYKFTKSEEVDFDSDLTLR
jgi:hypothetical protein